MTCTCREHVEYRQTHGGRVTISCFWNSRKLREAWPFLQGKLAELKTMGEQLHEADCENNRGIWELVITMFLKVWTGISERFKYLSLLPWALARADEIEGAKEVMKQIRAVDWDKHDPYTRRFMTKVGGHAERRSEGSECHAELTKEVKAVNNSPLVEDFGEGYHRSTHHEKSRAPASTSRHVKQSVRQKEAMDRVKAFMAKHGRRGRRVVRFEYRRFKRILQAKARHKWRGVHMSTSAVYARVYREDERAADDFSTIVNRQDAPSLIKPDSVSGKEALRNEYLVSVMQEGVHYSVGTNTSEIQADGSVKHVVQPSFFPLDFHGAWVQIP